MSQELPKLYKRRPHSKSKTGCGECRRRRTKCDEEKPSCRSCVRRSIRCVYSAKPQTCGSYSSAASDATSVRSTAESPGVVGRVSSGSPSSFADARRAVRHPSTPFIVDDLPLLHYWTLSTSQSISESPGFDSYWQSVFPHIGFQHPFVMHGILSVAALHRAYLHDAEREQRIIDAAQHHNIALQGFQEQVAQINGNNSDALFACASLNVLYVFAVSAQQYDRYNRDIDPAQRRSQILGAEWIQMIRGVEAVLHSVYDRICLGPMNQWLDLGNWKELDPDKEPAEVDEQMRPLRKLWAGTGEDGVYEETLYILRKCCAYTHQFSTMDPDTFSRRGHRRVWSGHLAWLHFAPKEYFVRLQQRQPVALLLFAYFGTLLHDSNSYWFMENWGQNIVAVVGELLGEYWNPWLSWPKEVVGLG